MAIRAQIKGYLELRQALKQMPAEFTKGIERGIEDAARLIVAEQKRLVPVRTGLLKDSIRWGWGNPPKSRTGAAAISGTPGAKRAYIVAGEGKAFYGAFVEWGTTFMKAHPFFFAGYNNKKVQAINVIHKTTEAYIKRSVAGLRTRFHV